jgi:hypothetical protein
LFGCPPPALHRIQKANQLQQASGKTLDSQRWAGAIDAAGWATSATLTQMRLRGSLPALSLERCSFLLRVVKLRGVNSVMSPSAERQRLGIDILSLTLRTETDGWA